MATRATISGLPFMMAHEMLGRFVKPKKGEQALILADGESDMDFVHAFAAAFNSYGAESTIMIMPPTFLEEADRRLPGVVVGALRECDIYLPLVATSYAAIHDLEIAHCLWDKTRPKNLRRFTPGGGFATGLQAGGLKFVLDALRRHDYNVVREWGEKFSGYLNRGKEIRVTSDIGTDLVASIDGIDCFHASGAFALVPGDSGPFPGGETAGGPVEFTGEGTIVIDGPIAHVAEQPKLKEPVTVTVKAGRITDIRGGAEAAAWRKLIDANENADVLSEIALGTNPYLEHTGSVQLTDKRILGTAHVAFGENQFQIYPYGTVFSPIHIDCILLKPNCWVDGVQLLKDGVPVV